MCVKHNLRAVSIRVLLVLVASLGWSSTLAHDFHDGKSPRGAEASTAVQPSVGIRALIREFRRTGNDRNLDAAWNRLQPMLPDSTQDASVLVDAAIVAQSRHDFDTALELLDRALDIQPGFAQGWLVRASVELVRGNPDRAKAACARLRNVPAFIAVTCHARVGIARGEQASELKKLAAVLAAVDTTSADPEALAWSLSVAGDAAAASKPERAIAYYERSLENAESTQVRAALVDVLLATGRAASARSALESGHDALPLALRRLIVAVRLGEADSVAGKVALMDCEFRHWIAHRDWAHAREMARFYIDVLDRPELAQRLVCVNLGLQREPEDLALARRVDECSSNAGVFLHPSAFAVR